MITKLTRLRLYYFLFAAFVVWCITISLNSCCKTGKVCWFTISYRYCPTGEWETILYKGEEGEEFSIRSDNKAVPELNSTSNLSWRVLNACKFKIVKTVIEEPKIIDSKPK